MEEIMPRTIRIEQITEITVVIVLTTAICLILISAAVELHFAVRLLIVCIALRYVLAPMLQHWMKARPSAAGSLT